MSHVGHYQTPVGPEKIVVLEVGRQIDVGFRSGRGLDQRGPRPGRQSDSGNRIAAKRTVTYRAATKRTLDLGQETKDRHGLGQFADHAVAGMPAGRMRTEQPHVAKSQPAPERMAHPAVGAVQVGMGGIETDAGDHAPGGDALRRIAAHQPTQRVKQQRMMRHNEIRSDGQRLVYDFVGHVDAYQHAAHLRIGRTDIQAAVVVAFLQTERSELLDRSGHFSHFHFPYKIMIPCACRTAESGGTERTAKTTSARRPSTQPPWAVPASALQHPHRVLPYARAAPGKAEAVRESRAG